MYQIIEFNKKEFFKTISLVVMISILLTGLNFFTADYEWVKEGENYVLFFPVLVGILLYGFSVSAVFSSGQDAWNEVVKAVEENKKRDTIKRLIDKKPDFFPTFLVILGWLLLSACALLVQIPYQLYPLMFITHVVLTTPVFLALDYWGYVDGIKYISFVKK
ncbi:MAG: hypothetical protein HN846_05125 [Candidatus Pacebacteria bacterium]|jgi:hypothetical protein|nr:hypothetical protein [Candidatus Paceibacterota bacterium]MBT3512053.1 hypothetical protein [Candidatus Paceibacterota bacterium]MBT4004483.1 hypothetical protein [Candidatus Paceibacterota bacterium]MBT4359084.1 hypothetical protein [Candidatus Paceibacterota bacterium]MBT4681379.1 hypothetical protein [Candidatus Paceibacterota bacterium]